MWHELSDGNGDKGQPGDERRRDGTDHPSAQVAVARGGGGTDATALSRGKKPWKGFSDCVPAARNECAKEDGGEDTAEGTGRRSRNARQQQELQRQHECNTPQADERGEPADEDDTETSYTRAGDGEEEEENEESASPKVEVSSPVAHDRAELHRLFDHPRVDPRQRKRDAGRDDRGLHRRGECGGHREDEPAVVCGPAGSQPREHGPRKRAAAEVGVEGGRNDEVACSQRREGCDFNLTSSSLGCTRVGTAGVGAKRRRELLPGLGHVGEREGAARAEGGLADRVHGGPRGARRGEALCASVPCPGSPGVRVDQDKEAPVAGRLLTSHHAEEAGGAHWPVCMRPPAWLYLPHLGWGGGQDNGEVAGGGRAAGDSYAHGLPDAQGCSGEMARRPSDMRADDANSADHGADGIAIKGRTLSPGNEGATMRTKGERHGGVSEIRGRGEAPGCERGGPTWPARSGDRRARWNHGDGEEFNEPARHLEDGQGGGAMKRYFDSIAETVERRRRTDGVREGPSAADRLAALRRRIASRAGGEGAGAETVRGVGHGACAGRMSSRPPSTTVDGGAAAADARHLPTEPARGSNEPACSTACTEAASAEAFHTILNVTAREDAVVGRWQLRPAGALEDRRSRRALLDRLQAASSSNPPERAG